MGKEEEILLAQLFAENKKSRAQAEKARQERGGSQKRINPGVDLVWNWCGIDTLNRLYLTPIYGFS